MKLFITGATGFVGTHLIDRLGQTGHELHCLVLETEDATRLEALGVTLVRTVCRNNISSS